ncbi:MAG: cbb3-type cytochrome c oxidase subunit I [Ignavibacteriales bacterium]|nr:cbb3-type cytochrome c oxidase subunit I [Ignavibacteriales bacterium]
MFTTVRYFVKTSIIFLVLGILTGLYMSYSKYISESGYTQELISAHTHIILVGSVMMMIMGVALWFFPRAEKDDKKYNPDLIKVVYWLMATATFLRFIFQLVGSYYYLPIVNTLIFFFSALQVIAMILFFYSMWGRIRAVGSQYREAKGEKF